MYRPIIRSKLTLGENFQDWVTTDILILPSISRHGVYATTETIEKFMADPDSMIRMLEEIKPERAGRLNPKYKKDFHSKQYVNGFWIFVDNVIHKIAYSCAVIPYL